MAFIDFGRALLLNRVPSPIETKLKYLGSLEQLGPLPIRRWGRGSPLWDWSQFNSICPGYTVIFKKMHNIFENRVQRYSSNFKIHDRLSKNQEEEEENEQH